MTQPVQHATPLRYPGGKAALTDVLRQVVELNRLGQCRYVEPFAGGGGAALQLLFGEAVERILLNDFDHAVYCFWYSVLNRTDELLDLLRKTPVNIREWRRQRGIYQAASRQCKLAIGFATLYLNRCNRSGIIASAGPIGGIRQSGEWKIGVRFNKDELQRRIERVAAYGDRIEATRDDVLDCLRKVNGKTNPTAFVYLDPPYYHKGPSLYLNALQHNDHQCLADFLKSEATFPWVMTYDDAPEIRKMYRWCNVQKYSLRYSATRKELGSELMISPPDILLPTHQRSVAVRWPSKAKRSRRQSLGLNDTHRDVGHDGVGDRDHPGRRVRVGPSGWK